VNLIVQFIYYSNCIFYIDCRFYTDYYLPLHPFMYISILVNWNCGIIWFYQLMKLSDFVVRVLNLMNYTTLMYNLNTLERSAESSSSWNYFRPTS